MPDESIFPPRNIRERSSLESVGDSAFEFRMPAAAHFFKQKLQTKNGTIDAWEIAAFLSRSGFLRDDPRFKVLYSRLLKNEYEYRKDLTFEEAGEILLDNDNIFLLERAFKGTLVCPDFADFKKEIEKIFWQVKQDVPTTAGKNATYISQLAKVDPNLWGLSVCTIDGQRFSIGDANVPFSVQSGVKPLNYCLAIQEFGEEIVHQHLGRGPSGVAFNSLTLNHENRPHNPMINAGAIMACALIRPGEPLSERFSHISNQMKRLSGGLSWGFSTSVYLSERQKADSNYCLGYMMQGHNAFPKGTDLHETLDLYFQCCSLEVDCDRLAIAGATLANMGVCPTTGTKIFKTRTCRNAMSLMYSCGMYDYSGEWAFTVGVPAKSGVSGCIYVVIPDFGCISIYSPPIDPIGNSVRGVVFCNRLINTFNFHNFDSMQRTGNRVRIDPRVNKRMSAREGRVAALYAAAEGDLSELQRLIRVGVPITTADYDDRSLLHLSASNGHLAVVGFLLKFSEIELEKKDRWGGTALSEAIRFKHEKIEHLIRARMVHNGKIDTSESISDGVVAATSEIQQGIEQVTL